MTVLFNLPFTVEQATQLKQDIQGRLGCGATFKNGMIEIRGDQRDKIEEIFAAQGLKIKRAGG